MAESNTHIRLVERLVSHIANAHAEVAIFHDLPSCVGAEKPPRIGGYVPDVYATDAPTTVVVIGEAKTEGDLVTDHSRRQLVAFLLHLQAHPHRGVLIVAVPWSARATAHNLLVSLRAENACGRVTVEVLDVVEAPCSK